MVGRVYVGAHNPLDVVCGAALGIAIAGVVNLVDRPALAARAAGASRHGATATVGPAPDRVVPAARSHDCSSSLPRVWRAAAARRRPTPTLADDAITVGSFDFTESVVLAEVYSQGLEAAGYRVERAFSLGPREFVGPALAGRARRARAGVRRHGGRVPQPRRGRADRRHRGRPTRELVRALAGRPLVALAAAPGQDANTFVVTAETAAAARISTTISDLAGGRGRAHASAARPSVRPDALCLLGLPDVYGLHVRRVRAARRGRPAAPTRRSLQRRRRRRPAVHAPIPRSRTSGSWSWPTTAACNRPRTSRRSSAPRSSTGGATTSSPSIDAVSARLTTTAVRELERAPPAHPTAEVASRRRRMVVGGGVVTTERPDRSRRAAAAVTGSTTGRPSRRRRAAPAAGAGRPARHRRCPAASAGPGGGGSSSPSCSSAWLVVALFSPRRPSHHRSGRCRSCCGRSPSIRTGWLTTDRPRHRPGGDRVDDVRRSRAVLLVATVAFKRWRHLFTFLGSVVVLQVIGRADDRRLPPSAARTT